MFATVANAVLWLWTTVGVAAELLFQVIPASLGLVQTVDAGLARTLFSWTYVRLVTQTLSAAVLQKGALSQITSE